MTRVAETEDRCLVAGSGTLQATSCLQRNGTRRPPMLPDGSGYLDMDALFSHGQHRHLPMTASAFCSVALRIVEGAALS
ncbi:hypothetical protein EV178_006519, partial [Coemansia sp. RSA 1646]